MIHGKRIKDTDIVCRPVEQVAVMGVLDSSTPAVRNGKKTARQCAVSSPGQPAMTVCGLLEVLSWVDA
jgi:hypothetical protein